jgi:hypothetical protein
MIQCDMRECYFFIDRRCCVRLSVGPQFGVWSFYEVDEKRLIVGRTS